MSTPKYIQFIDETAKLSKDYIDRNELSHYMIGDTAKIDGTKVRKDGIKHEQIYELSVHSTILDIQEAMHDMYETGVVRPFMLEKPQQNVTILEDILKAMGTKVVTVDTRNKKATLEALKGIIKELEEGDK